MDDEHLLREVDERVGAALAPDPAAARRIVARALGGTSRRDPSRMILVAAVSALTIALGLAGWFARPTRRQSPPPLTSLSITSSGSMLVVDGDDGRRWVIGRAADASPRGRYVIVVHH
jgi:hypothetical protein